MTFTGKATYGANNGSLPEIAEDVSDIAGIVCPFETPLLAYLGDSKRAATENVHKWQEDVIKPSKIQRVWRKNHTQIFTRDIEVDGSRLAVNQIAIADEIDYQKQEKLREVLRDLENCVVNGVKAPEKMTKGNAVHRSMGGIISTIKTNVFEAAGNELTEELLNDALGSIYVRQSGNIDTIVVSGMQKRRINTFTGTLTCRDGSATTTDYGSDYGTCRVILSRWIPRNTVLLIDSSRIDVMPLRGRSFHYKPLITRGEKERGQIVGEYTVEVRNETAHGIIRGLSD